MITRSDTLTEAPTDTQSSMRHTFEAVHELMGAPVASDEQGMALALSMAQHAFDQNEVPVGAVIVQNGVVIGVGHNRPIGSCDPTAHAEVAALRAACAHVGNYRLPGATLYVTIEPCTMCCGALVHARIERLVYGAGEPKAGAIQSAQALLDESSFNHKIAVTAEVCEAPCAQLMSDFFALRRAQKRRLKAQLAEHKDDDQCRGQDDEPTSNART